MIRTGSITTDAQLEVMPKSKPSPYCGRIDEHEPHDHHTYELPRWKRTPLHCPGAPIIEGGSR